jgi:hypothetical protein
MGTGPTYTPLSPNYGAIKGPGDFSAPEPEDGMDENEVAEWLADNHGAQIQADAIELLADYLSSWQDTPAQGKLQRLFLALADKYERLLAEHESKVEEDPRED